MKDFVSGLIQKKKKRYVEDYGEMLGDYKRELETIKGYNGRQLLELLQNCDDEGATKVTITLNKNNKTITISNNGKTSFSKKGYRSLFIANLSSKTSRKYIGNKGLGFRSIINWSKSIEIQSNNLSLFYSEQNTKDNYKNLFSENERKHISTEEDLGDTTIPMPFLTMPVLTEINQGDFKTAIIIGYKKKALKDIIKQVKNITSETLLFLKHIEQVEFLGFEDVCNLQCTRSTQKSASNFSPKEAIQFKDNSWSIFEEEHELPSKFQNTDKNEKEFYQIKIAVEDNFNKSSAYLYSFFPTKIKLNQPYVLHATFDLDATRNQLNDSDKNRYILEKVVSFTIKVAKYYSEKKVSYRPLSILNHSHKADTLESLGYYKLIEEAISNEAVFPCIDNTYKTLDEVIYVNDQFAELLQEIDATDIIPIHLLPLVDLKLEDFNLEDDIDTSLDVLEDYLELINQISIKDLNLKQRALWIKLMIEEAYFVKREHQNSFNFLINKKGEIINGDEYIYTPISKDQELKTPNFTNIQFINEGLFNILINELNFNESPNSNKGRFIYDALNGFCNIHSYEPATLSQKIIRETNSAIEKESENSLAYIQEMNSCLYHNFKLMKEGTKIPDDSVRIPCITKSRQIAFTENVVLSEFYPTGRKTSLIFEGVYSNKNYIAKPIDLGLDPKEDEYELERFLKWTKVNSYAKYRSETVTDYGVENYVNYVEKYSDFGRYTGYNILYKSIDGFQSVLDKISLEKLILWVYYDEVLKQQLYDNNNEDRVRFFYRIYHTIGVKPSYLKYLIIKNYKHKFSEFLLDDKYSWVNNFKIDFKQIIDFDSKINKTIVNEILVSLGANDDFNQLPIEKVTEIINKLPENYPTGSKSQTFYKKALGHYNQNQIEITAPLRLFAHNGDELQLYDQSQIYFSEKIKLPNKLKKDFPIFNYPARAGGADAIKFFGINDLKEINIKIQEKEIIPSITAEFHSILEDLKPYLLSYRLNVIEDPDVRKSQASICKKIEILLCKNINYKVQEHYYEVADYEFLHYKDQTYLIRINQFDSVSSLRRNVNFTNSFADIIALAFDVNSARNEYKYILRSDSSDVQNSIKNDFGIDTLNDARELLGLADYKQAFWQAVFSAKNFSYNDFLDDLALEKRIKETLNIEFDTSSLDYENIDSENELSKLEQLFGELDLTLERFAEHYSYKINVAPYHLTIIKDAILSKKNLIKSSVWKSLEYQSIEKKALFLDIINKFENFRDFAIQKAEQLKHHFRINKKIIFQEYKDIVYPNLELSESINLEKIKRINKDSFTYDELYEISQSERLKSLVYFEDALEIIKEELNKGLIPVEEEFSNNAVSNPIGSSNKSLRILNSEVLKPKKVSQSQKRENVYTPKEKNTRGLKEKGNNSEQVVYNYLINNGYLDVDLVSEDNEGLQCDIRYTNENGEVKYVEVKTFDGGNFFLSNSEFEFGKRNKKDYEIWLVKNKQDIIPIYDFFSNRKYKIAVNEYLVHLEIVNENTDANPN